MSAQLSYYIFEGLLVGMIDGQLFHIPALSGGGGGSTKHSPDDSTNNPYMEALKTVDTKGMHIHGGPIPPGKYVIGTPRHHPHLGRCAPLVAEGAAMGRGGFFIHGRGKHGSDGCIVPLNKARFNGLMAALTASKGGILLVQESMSDIRFA